MKKLLVSIVAVFAVASVAQAQFIIGGNMDLTSVSPQEGDAATDLTIGVNGLYKISENIAVGAGISYGQEAKNEFGKKPSTFGFDVRGQYIKNIAGDFYWTPGVKVGMGFYDSKIEGMDTQNTFIVALDYASFEYKASECIGLTMDFGSVSYTSVKDGNSTFNANFNPFNEVGVGVRFHF